MDSQDWSVGRRQLGALGMWAAAGALGADRRRGDDEADGASNELALPTGPPTILSTDLSHPHVDPDDHVDLACAHGLSLDVRLIVLNAHASSEAAPGVAPVAQLNAVTGRSWSSCRGLATRFSTLQDRGTTEPSADAGAERIRRLLRRERDRAAIVVTGSCRDVAAAFNAERSLFYEKVRRIVIFAGDASAAGFVEHNVGQDPLAFLTLMGSGLPIRWVPCFDGGLWQAGTRSSFVRTAQSRLFPPDLPGPLLRYFSYMLSRATQDPVPYLARPVTAEDMALLQAGQRNLWAARLVSAVRDDGTVRWRGTTVGVFEPARVRFAMTGALDPAGPVEAAVERWRVLDPGAWQTAMVEGTVRLLRQVPTSSVPRLQGTLPFPRSHEAGRWGVCPRAPS